MANRKNNRKIAKKGGGASGTITARAVAGRHGWHEKAVPRIPRVVSTTVPMRRWLMISVSGDQSTWHELSTSLIFTDEKGLDRYRTMYLHNLEGYTEPVTGSTINWLWLQPWAAQAEASENRGSTVAYSEAPVLGSRASVGITYPNTSHHGGPFFRDKSDEETFLAWKSNAQWLDLYIDASFY